MSAAILSEYAKCRHAKCRYLECRGAPKLTDFEKKCASHRCKVILRETETFSFKLFKD